MSLTVENGEFVVFVGPSGCGKSTLLRAVAGLEDISRGIIRIGTEDVTNVPPSQRGVAMVFQSYALYPHMTVRANMDFGLKVNKVSAAERLNRIMAAAKILQLEEYLERKPAQLSGGQRQRVAIGRAIVKQPAVFLFDEPLSNLDAALRVQMRVELEHLHSTLGATMIYVTHDQTEAMVISDRIAVLENGRIVQLGKPAEVYSRPANRFVAGFMGTTSFIHGRVKEIRGELAVVAVSKGIMITGRNSGLESGQEVDVAVRPENIRFLWEAGQRSDSKENTYEVRVTRAAYVGELIDYQLDLSGSLIRGKGVVQKKLAPGDKITITLDPEQISILKG